MCEFNNGSLPKFNSNRKGKQEAKKFSTILSEAKQSLEFNDNYIDGGEEDYCFDDEDLSAEALAKAECFSCPYEDELEEQEQKTMVYLIGNYLN